MGATPKLNRVDRRATPPSVASRAGRVRVAAARPLLSPAGRIVALAVAAACVAVTALLGARFAHQTQAGWLDAAVDGRVQASLGSHPQLLHTLERLGRPKSIAAMTAALALACLVWRWYRGALLTLSVPAAGVITEFGLKPLFGRLDSGSLSFPSGHATGMFALAAAVTVLLFARPGGGRAARALRLLLSLAAFLVAAAVAIAMVGLGVHYFTDAVGGAAVGTGTVLATALALDLTGSGWRRRRERRPVPPPHREEQAADPSALPGQAGLRRATTNTRRNGSTVPYGAGG